jgi:N-acetylneuraminic acid mutarotase
VKELIQAKQMKILHILTAGLSSAASTLSLRAALPLLLLGAGLALVQPCAGGSGSFSNTGNLVTARFLHTATTLSDGKVLVAGGQGSNNAPLASAELYDPASGTWTATGSLPALRTSHTATLLANGKVLVAGGFNNSSNLLASAELYDPTSGTWTTTGSLGTPRYYHTATLLPNGKVLVAGGNNGADLASAELYDPASGTWTATGSLVTARTSPTATLLTNGKVLVVGGGSGLDALASAELYDPVSGTWTATGSLATARGGQTETLLSNGKVLVAGGENNSGPGGAGVILASAELYDPATGTWTVTGSLATARTGQTASLLPNGKVLVAGGVDFMHVFSSAELYDPTSGTWTATGSLAAARYYDTASLLSDGNVLVAGGHGAGTLASAELYISGQSGSAATLLNISTRMRVLTGEQVLIAGFIITGTDPKNVIIRGIGPSLNGVGVTLVDPTLELHQGGTTLTTNDNWKINDQTGQSQQAEIEATTIPPSNDLESAILTTLNPGAYTAILAGKNGGTGVGVVEVYDLAHAANSQLANISTRGFVDTGDNVMIGGFIVGGGTPNVIVLALGPSVPVEGALADPTLELHDVNGATIATNDNWKINDQTGLSQQAAIEATTVPPTNDLESALVQALAPGNYTAIVRGRNNTTGVGLVAAYNLH